MTYSSKSAAASVLSDSSAGGLELLSRGRDLGGCEVVSTDLVIGVEHNITYA